MRERTTDRLVRVKRRCVLASLVAIERTNGIRAAWIDYFATATGHRASMTAMVK